jgi:hypothetical protein
MRAHGSKFGVKTRPRNCQKLENVFGKIKIFLTQNPIFLAQNSIFFNSFLISEKSEKIFFDGFPISSMAFCFLRCISTFRNGFLIFLNGFPISSTAFPFSSTAFHFPRNPGKSIYFGKYTKDCYPSFVFQSKITIFRDKNNPQQEYKRSLSELCIFRSELPNSH